MATLSVTFTIPGATLYSNEECNKDFHLIEKNTIPIKDDRGNRRFISFNTRKSKSIKQTINMSDAAYNYMTAKSNTASEDCKNCPEWSKPKFWFLLSSEDRLKMHLARICRDLGGNHFDYQIFED